MLNTAKRFFAFFVLVALASATPVFANFEKPNYNANSKVYNVEFHGKKNIPVVNRMLTIGANHSYVLKLRQGETAVFTLRSDKGTTVRVKSPSGRVTEQNAEKAHQGVLSGVGEFVIEVSSTELSSYTLTISGN